ncbi:right-handed parallel beta-helix repeat-containing protein [Peteryoungia desertarenae]|uniref:Right-handed parallel beta-helix repeat-containing protein n=1 Tax=Peteryoungia desertarenae TaxID=1813451 RepID=A0ABX6QJI4_9HYPH|nr:glycosyl hydrolase family 28 protein [Peteryoungia desertarenae]QLF68452.1 right-handed parallel beta-helix repeat-containing protein [Peteryoungia desertarenae]
MRNHGKRPVKNNEILFVKEHFPVASLQEQLDYAAEAGCVLELPPGIHSCAALKLPSGLHLHLAAGAVLRPVDGYAPYETNRIDVIAEKSDRAIILAKNEKNIRISGDGLVDAPGAEAIIGRLDDMGTHIPAEYRPRVLVFDGCENIRLEGFSIRQSPMWTIHLIGCRNVEIDGVRVTNDTEMPNTDGIVIDACEDVAIRNCHITTADDGIVLKTSMGPDGKTIGHCRNILVENTYIESNSCALKIGTESHGDFENIRFSRCRLMNSNRGMGIFSRDGGWIANILFDTIEVECFQTPDGFWGSGEAITVNCLDRRPGKIAGIVENIRFRNISGTMEGAINFVADSKAGIRNVDLSNITLKQVDGPLKGRTYDVRPTHFDLAPSPDAAGRANAWVKDADGKVIGLVPYPGGMPALFALNVENLTHDAIRFTRPDPLPEGFHPESDVIVNAYPTTWSVEQNI